MSGKYNPDDDAEQLGIWTTVFLSNRDLSSQIPVNFVTHPGVSLTSACFENGTYTAGIAEKCISNLLATQFRRLVLDLYWDEKNGQFAFCPVAIPASIGSGYESVSLTASAITSAPLTESTSTLGVRQATSASTATPSSVSSSQNSSSTTTTALPPIKTLASLNGETLYDLGSYACSPSLDLSFFISVMSSYLAATSDTINAKLIYLELNLHASASRADPDGPAPEPKSFPIAEVLVGAQFGSSLDHSPIYQPSNLASDRSNLNDSWFRNPEARWPIAEYFNTEKLSNGDLSSSDAWPDENYLQLTMAKRVFLTWGTIDPQMANYNFSGDASTIFANDQLSTPHQIQTTADGALTSGCFYHTTPSPPDVSAVNSSWALTTYSPSNTLSPPLLSNLSACGLSPLLNSTLTLHGASNNIAPYTTLARSSIWNWAPSEPRNTSAADANLTAPESQYRCAYMALDPSRALGRWYVQDCTRRYRAACRVGNQPYAWTLSGQTTTYAAGPDACPAGSGFDVPRTGLENAYLYHHILSLSASLSGSASPRPTDGVWINFNSLDFASCWVSTGPDGSCPYYLDATAIANRQVLVPTIGGFIVLVLTALTLFVKCNVNRRNSRARRRGDGGWDYEGVPN